VSSVLDLKTRIFADGANQSDILDLYRNPVIRGFTTNPTLMRAAGVTDYEMFARELLEQIPDRPISFEVFADDPSEMKRQALRIASWAQNVYVKIPITTTDGESALDLVADLAAGGVKVNVTAMMTAEQVRGAAAALNGGPSSYVSVFAGRIADTGRDPIPIMAACMAELQASPNVELIWASPRELLNLFQADAIGCHIITVTKDVLKKLDLVGKDLLEYSLDTVRMFHEDGVKAGYVLEDD
jgi:transaldolase